MSGLFCIADFVFCPLTEKTLKKTKTKTNKQKKNRTKVFNLIKTSKS